MTNDGPEPTSRPGADADWALWDTNPWIIVDDTVNGTEEAPGTAPEDTTPGRAAPEPPRAAPRGDGWASFAQDETWDGIPVTPPRSESAGTPQTAPWAHSTAPPGASPSGAAAQAGAGEPWTTAHADSDSAWGAPADGTDQDRPAGSPENAWFFVEGPEGDGHQDDFGEHDVRASARRAPAGRTLTGRGLAGRGLAGRISRPGFGAVSVTLLVSCLGVLLVISSAVWHPQAP